MVGISAFFSLLILKKAGFSLQDLKNNYKLNQLKYVGFTLEELKKHFTLEELKNVKFTHLS